MNLSSWSLGKLSMLKKPKSLKKFCAENNPLSFQCKQLKSVVFFLTVHIVTTSPNRQCLTLALSRRMQTETQLYLALHWPLLGNLLVSSSLPLKFPSRPGDGHPPMIRHSFLFFCREHWILFCFIVFEKRYPFPVCIFMDNIPYLFIIKCLSPPSLILNAEPFT